MKTSVIRYRVADFLKQYPPFDSLPEADLLELAGSGRVSFHESEEFLCQKDQPFGPTIRVIQQGKVEILDETTEQLHDVLGEGDILSLERYLPAPAHLHSARTATDVILYSLDAKAFEAARDKHPSIAAFLDAKTRFAPTAPTWLDTPPPAETLYHRRLVTVDCTAPITEAATRLAAANTDACAVLDNQQHPTGWITPRELTACLATGDPAPSDPCRALANRDLTTTAPGKTTAAYQLEMMRARSPQLAVTSDGTPDSPIQGILRAADLAILSGRDPVRLLLEIQTTGHWPPQVDTLLADALSTPAAMDAAARFAHLFHSALTEAAVAQTLPLDTPACWLFFGIAGRGETLVPAQPDLALIYENDAAADAATQLHERVTAHLAAGGLRPRPSQSAGPRCLSLSRWKSYFSELIRNPILAGVYDARGMFDFRPVLGDTSLALALTEHIAAEIEKTNPFIPILANDTLAALPPLTFFQGMVIAMDGASTDTLDLRAAALVPIIDAARVFALANGNTAVANTLERLERAAEVLPDIAAPLRHAADAFRTVAYHLARTGRTTIDPSKLNRYDQRLLKNALAAIHDLLKVTTATYGIGEEA